MIQQRESRRPLRIWLWLLGITCTLVILGVTILWWWCHSTNDLEAVRAEARAAQISTDFNDMGLVTSTPELTQLAKRLRDTCPRFFSSRETPDELLGWTAFTPVPEAFRSFHRAKDSNKMDAWLVDVDALPGSPIILAHNPDEWLKANGWTYAPGILLAQRIVVAEEQHLGQALTRLLRLIDSLDTSHPEGFWSRTRTIKLLRLAIIARLPELMRDPGELPERLRRLADTLSSRLAATCQGVFVAELASFTNGRGGPPNTAWPRPLQRIPAAITGRQGRGVYLRQLMDIALRLEQESDSRSRIAFCRLLQSTLKKQSEAEIGPVLVALHDDLYDHIVSSISQELSLRLLANELTGNAWPKDVFALNDAPLQRCERDGRMIGAYSVGWNGIDEGGAGDDRYFGLYGSLEPPVSAGP